MTTIHLTRGFTTTIDDEDADLAEMKWCAHINKGKPYAARSGPRPRQKWIALHKVVADRMGLIGMVDHIDRNSLNNTRANLRSCTNAQNLCNSIKRAHTSSKYKGVHMKSEVRGISWAAQIQKNGKRKFLGRFRTEKAAAREYDKHAKELYGEFAVLNLPK